MTKKAVVQAIEAAHYVVENDTDVAVGQVEVLERITHNAAAQYADFTNDLRPHVATVTEFNETKLQMKTAENHLDVLESSINNLEALVDELDQWSTELQVKVERLQG